MLKIALPALLALICFNAPALAADPQAQENPPVPSALDFDIIMIDGSPARLSQYHGQVILLVNVASKCGFTKQYTQLQALHEKYAEQGLIVLGVPANNFGSQEPGSNKEIAEFCSSKFHVTFDMLEKVSVKGDDIAPLYKFLTEEETNPEFAGPIKWNFNKFLIDRQGKVIARFDSKVKPDAPEAIEKIEAALKAPEPKVLCEDAIKWREAKKKATSQKATSDE